MYEEDKLTADEAINQANAFSENQRKESEAKRIETMQKMQENQEQQNKLKDLAQALGIENMQHEIDDIKTVVTKQDESLHYLAERMNDMIKAINNVSASIQGNVNPEVTNQATVTTAGASPHINTLLGILESPIGEKLFSRLFPDAPTAAPTGFLSQDYINEQVSNAIKRKFELGDIVVDAVESSLTKGLTKQIVKSTLQNAAQNVHEPE